MPSLYREVMIKTQIRGATPESINATLTYKFEMNNEESNSAVGEGGVVAAGTEKERMVAGEDAENNDELRELRCSHLFHKDCVDKWLKINALCPLCKSKVGESRVENGLSNTSS